MGRRISQFRTSLAIVSGLALAVFLRLTLAMGVNGEPFVASNADDFDADGSNDEVIAAPQGDSARSDPGEVSIKSGENGELIITFIGKQADDLFGWAVHASTDFTGDTYKDVLIGAPYDGQGHVFLFHGPFVNDDILMMKAENADLVLTTDLPTAIDFGSAVKSIADLDGDHLPDIMVACWHEDATTSSMFTYYFSSATGRGIVAVKENGFGFDPWAPVPGDVDGDGEVTWLDLEIVLANAGLANATRAQGDLNDDGIVSGLDAMIVFIEQGSFPVQASVRLAPSCDGHCCCHR